MNYPKKYIYPAVFTFYKSSSIGVYFPDLPGCVSSANSLDEALYMASEALGIHLAGMEEDGDALPQPSDILALKSGLEASQVVVPVSVLMARYRAASKNVNKMCTVPAWLVDEADDAGLSYSRTLQEALMEKLGLKQSITRKRKR